MATRREADTQLDLFGAGEPRPASSEASSPRLGPVGPSAVPPALAAIAADVPPTVRLGTSSWAFPGWAGIVYDRPASPTRLARDGLAAYARHPLLRAVGIDRTYYAPISAAAFAAYAAVVPDNFRFLVKAHELCTIARFPRHARYAAHAGEHNVLCLDAAYATDEVVGPFMEGLRDHAGPLLFQFPPQDVVALGGPSRFAERVHTFLRALPRGPLYAVELRNRELLTDAYVAALADVGACHCLNAHPSMPPVRAQADWLGPPEPRALVIRWMLASGYAYEAAKAHYQPFDRLVDEDAVTHDAIADLCLAAAAAARPAFVIINNKAEGSAPLSAFRLAERIARVCRPAA